MPFFSCVAMSASIVLPRRHSSMNACSAGLRAPAASAIGCSAAIAMNVRAEQGVGARGEHLERAIRTHERLGVRCEYGNAISQPSDLPIQLACIVFTRSGQSGSFSRSPNNSSAYLRDAEVVHRDFAFLDDGAGAPAAAVDHLLVGEHGLVHRIPVRRRRSCDTRCPSRACAGTATGSSGSKHGSQVAISRDQSNANPSDFSCAFMYAMLSRVHFAGGTLFLMAAFSAGRPNASQPMGCKHALALHLREAREHVTDRVVAHVAHVQPARRIREHGQAVELSRSRRRCVRVPRRRARCPKTLVQHARPRPLRIVLASGMSGFSGA